MKNLINFLLVGTWGYVPKCVAWFFIFATPTGCYHTMYNNKPVMLIGSILGALIMGLSIALTLLWETKREAKPKK